MIDVDGLCEVDLEDVAPFEQLCVRVDSHRGNILKAINSLKPMFSTDADSDAPR